MLRTFFLEQIKRYFRTHSTVALHRQGQFTAFEFKFSDAPKITRSMHSVLQNLSIEHLYVIYPGDRNYSLSEKITVKGLGELPKGKDRSISTRT